MSQPPTPTPRTEPQVDTTQPQHPGDAGSAGSAGKLPHERDQSVNMTDQAPSPDMQQAHRDLQKGLVDTDARGADGKPLGDDVPAGS